VPGAIRMAYFRGDIYVFDTGDDFHLWRRECYTSHAESGWGECDPANTSGLQIPVETMDRFVLMRLAELVAEKQAVARLDAFLRELAGGGNCGNIQLLGNEAILREALVDLEAKVRRVTLEDIGW
jgi:hypothetical protein